MAQGGKKVFVTNYRPKSGPLEVEAGTLYVCAHQAYWGFRFLREKRELLWKAVLEAGSIADIQRVGAECAKPCIMAGAGFGAAGMMAKLTSEEVAWQVLAARRDSRRYPGSPRPSSEDRRMVFLAIAVGAGVCDRDYSTVLRKLAEAGLGLKYLQREVHRFDHAEERMKRIGFLYAEPIGNFFCEGILVRPLPCSVPKSFRGGFILYGYGSCGLFQTTFSQTLPSDLTLGEATSQGSRSATSLASARPNAHG